MQYSNVVALIRVQLSFSKHYFLSLTVLAINKQFNVMFVLMSLMRVILKLG